MSICVHAGGLQIQKRGSVNSREPESAPLLALLQPPFADERRGLFLEMSRFGRAYLCP